MHELAISLALIDEAERVARQHGARAVAHLRVVVGPLSGVDGEQLARAYSIARAGRLTAEATLEWSAAPVRVCCEQCGATTDAAAQRLLCADCGSWRTRVVSGADLTLQSIELIDARH
ncbi:MAG TPA: hydrogenase maturation nickel metallochaperone HypA [Steroidobacteraceae bacterium]|nr:hydrogenase maturation nickel metallochaperone HypA [Steroidobacteraceae bacterium]